MAKEIISESRLREIISEETKRFKKKLALEAEKKTLLKKLNEMYMEDDAADQVSDDSMLDEVALDEVGDVAAHKEAIDFIANHPQSQSIITTYQNGKQNQDSLKKFVNFINNYAKTTLGKNNEGATIFLNDVTRVIEDKLSARVNTDDKSTF
jgi:hypothetical protein